MIDLSRLEEVRILALLLTQSYKKLSLPSERLFKFFLSPILPIVYILDNIRLK